jgi:UDP-GlcNAc3NAcA epimerase
VFPLHPRTKKQMKKYRINIPNNVLTLKPVSYFESLAYQTIADIVITDSGGMQKEAYIIGTPCITLRDETEWTETLKNGFNTIVGSDVKKFMKALGIYKTVKLNPDKSLFGRGDASEKITNILKRSFS